MSEFNGSLIKGIFMAENNPISTNPLAHIASLDLLRGIAILGILFMNIVSFAMPEPAYPNVNWHGLATENDKLFFALQYLLVKEKFIALFCVLFGAGLVSFWKRAHEKSIDPIALLRKRSGWLLALGLLHMTFLFYGDILMTYAICGFLVIQFIPNDAKTLMNRGILFTIIGMLIMMGLATLTFFELEPDMKTSMLGYPYNQESVSEAINLAVGSYLTMIEYNATTGIAVLLLWPVLFWMVAGPMLIGMSLIKEGFFQKGTSVEIELCMFFVGLSLSAGQLYMILSSDFAIDFWLLASFNTVGGLLIILTIASRLIKAIKRNPFWLMPLQYVGRMALSFYILQSIAMTLLFRVFLSEYFGLWHLGELMVIAIVVSVIQIQLATWWQKNVGQGPLEQLLRVLIHTK